MNKDLKTSAQKILWIALLFGTAFIVVSAVENKSVDTLTEMVIEIDPVDGDKFFITEGDVKKIVKSGFGLNPVGEKMLDVDAEALEDVLEKEAFIKKADAYFDANDKIHIKIRQRKPLLRIMDSNGLNYYLDEEGVKMPVSKNYTARVMVATGSVQAYAPDFLKKEGHQLKDLFELTKFIHEDEFLFAMVEQIHVHDKEFVLIPKIGKQKILLGTIDKLQDKIDRLKIFYEKVMPREGWNTYSRIDLRFEGQVIGGK
jgi:cell division protein FtsQ